MSNMPLYPNEVLDPVSHSSKIAQRLLAHARLCRQIAGETWNEHTAEQLEQMAEECDRAVAELGGPDDGCGTNESRH